MIDITTERPEAFGEMVLEESISSDLDLKNPMIDQIIGVLRSRDMILEVDEMGVRLCLDEALVNAIRHGNGKDPSKHVHVRLYADDERWAIEIEDEGDGFTPEAIPDPDDPESLLLERGRGVLLMMHYMDQVSYHLKGNLIRMMRSIRTAA